MDRIFGGRGSDYGYGVQQTSDGGYVIVGSIDDGGGYWDIWLIKTDAEGNKEWYRAFKGPRWEEGHFVQQTSDGGYIMVGITTDAGGGWFDVWLIKTDAEGDKEWDRAFEGMDEDVGYCVQQTADGGYIIAGVTGPSGGPPGERWLIRTDAQGNKVWDRRLGREIAGTGSVVQETSDGGYIVVGYKSAVRLDAQGNTVWEMKLEGQAHLVQQTSDGGYIIAGTAGGTNDFWLVKLGKETVGTALPLAPPTPTAVPTTPRPSPTPRPLNPLPDCPDPNARITSPRMGDWISGVVPFKGSANVPDLQYYKFEYRPVGEEGWRFLVRFDGPVAKGTLMEWHTYTVPKGEYELRLTVIDRSGNYPEPCVVRVRVY